MTLKNLLPQTVTNDFDGHVLAKWVLVALTLMTLGRSLVHMLAEDGGAISR